MADFVKFGEIDNKWTIEEIFKVVSKINAYCEREGLSGAELVSVKDNTVRDPKNQRHDIILRYSDSLGVPVRHKLLMMKDEIISGKEFSERFYEFYPEREEERGI